MSYIRFLGRKCFVTISSSSSVPSVLLLTFQLSLPSKSPPIIIIIILPPSSIGKEEEKKTIEGKERERAGLHICAGPPVARMTLEAMKKRRRRRRRKRCFSSFASSFHSYPGPGRFCLRVKWLTGSQLFFFFFKISSYNPGATPAPCGEVCKKIFIKHSDIIDFFSSKRWKTGRSAELRESRYYSTCAFQSCRNENGYRHSLSILRHRHTKHSTTLAMTILR